MIWLLLVIALLSGLAYNLLQRKAISKHGARIKSAPNRSAFVGHGIHFLGKRHELFEFFVQTQRKNGFNTLEIDIPTLPPGVIISDPANIEFVLKNESLVSKGSFVKGRVHDLFGNGIINSSGSLWKAQRKAGLKFFSGDNLDTMVEEVLPEAYSRMKSQLLEHVKAGTIVDMQSVFLDYSSFAVGHMAYNMELDSSHPFSKAFDYASDQIGRRFQNPVYPITEFLFGSKLRSALAEVKQFGRRIVAKAKHDRSKAAFESLLTNDEPTFDTLIDMLMESFRDPNIVADSALNFLSAGKDTTAQSFTWTLYAILRHPEVLEPLQKEIASLNAKSDTSALGPKFTVADLQSSRVPYLMAAYYEALRLYPPIPIEIQECQQDLTLPDGTFLPQNAVIVWSIWAVNRAKEIYGEDADDFRPSRWLDAEGKFVNRSAFEFPVFNGGPRSCLGKQMAVLMAVYLLSHLLQDFQFTEVIADKGSSVERRSQNSLTLPMADGLPCNISI